MEKKVEDPYSHILIAKCSRDEALSIASLSPKERKRLLLKAAFEKIHYLVQQRDKGSQDKQS